MPYKYSVNDREILKGFLRLFDDPNILVKKGKVSHNGGASWEKSDWFEDLADIVNQEEKENENAHSKKS